MFFELLAPRLEYGPFERAILTIREAQSFGIAKERTVWAFRGAPKGGRMRLTQVGVWGAPGRPPFEQNYLL